MASTKMIGASRSIIEENRVETRSSKEKSEAYFKEISEANRVQTRSYKRRREASPEDPKAKEKEQSWGGRCQRAWGDHFPRMPLSKDIEAYNKAIMEGKLFDIPVSSSGYLFNSLRPASDIKQPIFMEVAKLAIKAYNEHHNHKDSDSEYKVKEIEKVNVQSFGMSFRYYITFKASSANKDPVPFQAEVSDLVSEGTVIIRRVHQPGSEDHPNNIRDHKFLDCKLPDMEL